jgi:hypothetical protein
VGLGQDCGTLSRATLRPSLLRGRRSRIVFSYRRKGVIRERFVGRHLVEFGSDEIGHRLIGALPLQRCALVGDAARVLARVSLTVISVGLSQLSRTVISLGLSQLSRTVIALGKIIRPIVGPDLVVEIRKGQGGRCLVAKGLVGLGLDRLGGLFQSRNDVQRLSGRIRLGRVVVLLIGLGLDRLSSSIESRENVRLLFRRT